MQTKISNAVGQIARCRMQIVIDIDDMAYEFVQNTSFVEDESTLFKQTNADREKTLFLYDILDAIKSGTPLPKGHGRLIDADELSLTMAHMIDRMFVCDAPTIIEADKAGDEE
jgi:hypothetical protein